MATTSATAEWGVNGSSGFYSKGVVTDVQVHVEFSSSPELNEVGAVIQQAQYDEHKTATATIQCKHDVALPAKGDSVEIKAGASSVKGYVTGCDIVESNQAYVKATVNVECYTNCAAYTAYPKAGSGS